MNSEFANVEYRMLGNQTEPKKESPAECADEMHTLYIILRDPPYLWEIKPIGFRSLRHRPGKGNAISSLRALHLCVQNKTTKDTKVNTEVTKRDLLRMYEW